MRPDLPAGSSCRFVLHSERASARLGGPRCLFLAWWSGAPPLRHPVPSWARALLVGLCRLGTPNSHSVGARLPRDRPAGDLAASRSAPIPLAGLGRPHCLCVSRWPRTAPPFIPRSVVGAVQRSFVQPCRSRRRTGDAFYLTQFFKHFRALGCAQPRPLRICFRKLQTYEFGRRIPTSTM